MQSTSKTDLDLTQIKQLTRAAMGAEAIQASELSGGWANSIYKIRLEDDSYCVIKISPPPGCPVMRYERGIISTEVAVLQLLARHEIAVPEVYAFLEAGELIDHPCFFMEYLDGSSLTDLRHELETLADANREIEQKLGALQARINNIGTEFDSWGSITGTGMRFANWGDCFASMLNDVLLDAEDAESNLGLSNEQIREILHSNRDALNIHTHPALVLWDLHDGNIMMKDGKIRAVIDCDRAFLGDPLMEFWFRKLAGDRSILQKAFLREVKPAIYTNDQHSSQTRNRLYDLYLSLVMRIECDFRGFAADHREWTQTQLQEAIKAFS